VTLSVWDLNIQLFGIVHPLAGYFLHVMKEIHLCSSNRDITKYVHLQIDFYLDLSV